jgi:hypothetical protein
MKTAEQKSPTLPPLPQSVAGKRLASTAQRITWSGTDVGSEKEKTRPFLEMNYASP